MRRAVFFALVFFVARVAAAQPTDADIALAQSLFEEGNDLMRNGRFADACPKLAESQRLDPGGGTLLNLAVCLEKDGKLASAYLAYNETLAVAERDGNKSRETIARDRLAVIGPMVSRVVIVVAPEAQALDSLEVRFDTASVRRAAWGVAAPVDLGEHVVTASANGKHEWRGVIRVDKPGAVVEVKVPALEDLPKPLEPLPLPKPAPRIDPPNTQRTIAFGFLGVAGASLVTGIITGGIGAARHADSKCVNGSCSTIEGVSAERDANAFAWASNISFGATIALAATGAVLFFTAPKSRHVGVGVTVGPAGLGVHGRF